MKTTMTRTEKGCLGAEFDRGRKLPLPLARRLDHTKNRPETKNIQRHEVNALTEKMVTGREGSRVQEDR